LKILLDESVPVQVRNALVGHVVSTVSGLGWKGMENGALLAAIEQTDIAVFVIADKNLRYQQNLTSRRSSNCGRITARRWSEISLG